uniref:Uncharacterized protein n=1 Tax=Arundo donax TaxID=35708 RepID=A0A0A8Y672_ARUDO
MATRLLGYLHCLLPPHLERGYDRRHQQVLMGVLGSPTL